MSKKSEDDNWHGVPKFVQEGWDKTQRENRRVEKHNKLKRKTSDKDGKGKR